MSTGILLPAPVLIAEDVNGHPISGAKLQLYLTGTSTPTPGYANGNLSTPLSNPVVANSAGQFPAIYLDPTITYRIQLQNAAGAGLADIDPVNLSITAATQAQVNAGVATGVYVSPATLAGWTGIAAALGYVPVNKAGDTATNLVINPAAPVANSAGYLGSPINTQNGAYGLILSDCGKTIYSGTGTNTYTIPTHASVAFPIGTVIAFANASAGSLTIAPAGGVTLNLIGAGTTGSRTLAQWGLATMTQIAADTWLIGGTGLT
jgi:hypothetical protein